MDSNSYLKTTDKLLFIFYGFCTLLLVSVLWTIREDVQGLPVLNYHQINPVDVNALTVPPEDFAAQMQYLHDNGYETISPEELNEFLVSGKELPPRPVLITFDDGYEDNYTYAYPILKQYNMKATIFLVSDFMNRFDNYLTWQQVYDMSENNIYMGSHTLSHFELPSLSTAELEQQVVGGKLAVEWHTFKFCEYIAYPCGYFNDQVLSEVKKTNYKGGFTVFFDYVRAGDDPYTLNRIPIYRTATMPLPRFWLRLHAAPIVGRLERLQTWIGDMGYTGLASFIPIP